MIRPDRAADPVTADDKTFFEPVCQSTLKRPDHVSATAVVQLCCAKVRLPDFPESAGKY